MASQAEKRDAMDPPEAESSDVEVGDTKQRGDTDDLRVPGPLRRNAGLLAVVLAAVVLGPAISRVLSTYRGIVLEVRDDQMLVAQANVAPKWVDAIGAQAGRVVHKAIGAWDPTTVESEPRDFKLTQLYERYVRIYEGLIVAINPPNSPSGASTAVIELDGGGRTHVSLWADHLAGAAVGRRVKKAINSWDPVLLDDVRGDPPVELMAPSSGSHEPSKQ